MKKIMLTLLAVFTISTSAFSANPDFYKVQCSTADGTQEIYIEKMGAKFPVLNAIIGDYTAANKLDNLLFKQNPQDSFLEVMEDFFGTGLTVLAGGVTDQGPEPTTFGTIGIILKNNDLFTHVGTAEYDVFYMEAMTGREYNTKMNCTFEVTKS